MLRIALLAAGATALIASVAHADVYKYVDKDGHVQYTDRPLTLPAERLDIETHRSDVVELDKHESSDSNAANSDDARQKAAQAQQAKRAAEDMNSAKKAEECAKAREAYRIRMTNFRMYEDDGKGNRRYLSSEEIDAARKTAKQAMDTLCGESQ